MRALEGKSVVIIGGTSGIGLATARLCADSGAHLAVVGADADSVAAAKQVLDADVSVFEGDARDANTAQNLIETARERFGSLDACVHIAGGSGRRWGDGPLHEISDEGWERTLDLNLKGLFYSNRAAIRAFLEQGSGGAIVNMSSALVHGNAPLHFATHAYTAAKAAVEGLTRAAAAYYAPHNIRVNAVAPGLTETPMAERAMSNREIMRYVRSRQPLDGGRAASPEDVAGAIVYLLSDAAKFVTGQVLAVDGGWSVSDAANWS